MMNKSGSDGNAITTGQLARLIGIPRYRLQYYIDTGQVPDSKYRVAGRRVFSNEEVQIITQMLGERKNKHGKE